MYVTLLSILGHSQLDMFTCPSCKTSLNKSGNIFGLFYVCPSCDGRAVTLEVVRKIIPRPMVNRLWQRARSGQYEGTRQCPVCRRRMPEVPILSSEKTEYIDVCTGCRIIWFDPQEFECLPKVDTQKPQEPLLSIEARQALALERLELLKKEQEQNDQMSRTGPDHWWQVIQALFGIPIEYNYTPLKHKPIVTWSLAAVITLVSIIAFRDLKDAVVNFGMIPAQFTRYFGFTLISAFFLHGGLFHLIGNLYFLLVFGDNTEDVLGKRNYLLLIAIAAIVGNIAHILGDPSSMVPCIGASGGISGILAYYCLRFRKARVGMILFFRWVRMPVVFMLAIWIIFQILGAYLQVTGLSNVSALAHLGGASVGIIFWWKTRASFSKTAAAN